MNSSNENENEKHFLSGKKIIIAGCGIGGITFGIALKQFLDKTNEKIDPLPSITIYERDPSSDAIGREGYSLSLRGDPLSGGMQILQKLNLLDQLIEESNPGIYFTLFDNNFSPLMKMHSPPIEGLPQPSMRISRSKLREILIKNLDPSISIHWNCPIKSAKELDNGNVLVYLSNGSEEECNLLIVADGSNSIVRNILRPKHQLNFAGARLTMGRTHSLDKFPVPFNETFGGVIGGDGHFLFVAPSDKTSIVWGISYLSSTPCQPKSAGTLDDNEIDQILEEVKQRTQIFSEPAHTIIKQTLRSSINVFNARDIVPFKNHGSVIFIGDAQHAMSPYSGNGANMAIMDGYQLAQQLVGSKDLNTAIQSYDDLSIPRSTTAINMSHRVIAMGHSKGIWKFIYVNILKLVAWYFGRSSTDNHRQQTN